MPLLEDLLAQPGFTPALLVVGVIMYGAWTAAYLAIIAIGFQDRTYGVPLVCVCLNVVWEFIFTFEVTDARLHWFLIWGNGLWFFFDVVIVTQLFLYGKNAQVTPWARDWFYAIAGGTLLAAMVGLYTSTIYFRDVKGVASSMTMNLAMSALFIPVLFARPHLRGLSYAAAWLKLIGTAAGSVFLYYWWPAQFKEGRMITHPEIPEPPGYGYMLFLYVTIFALDCLYVYLLGQQRRKLRSARGGGSAVPLRPAGAEGVTA